MISINNKQTSEITIMSKADWSGFLKSLHNTIRNSGGSTLTCIPALHEILIFLMHNRLQK